MSASLEHPSISFHHLDDHHQLDSKTIIIRLSSVSKSTRGLSNNHMRKRNVLNLLSASVMIMMAMSATRWTNVLRCSTAWTSWQHKMLSTFWLRCIHERSAGCQLESTAYTGAGRPEVVSISQLEKDVILETDLCLGLQFVKAKLCSQPLLIFVKGDPWCAILARLFKALFNKG